jgi:hypothetical protein
MVVEYKGIGIDNGKYAIQLGEILESKNVTWGFKKRYTKNQKS